MSLKDEARVIVLNLFGPINADKVAEVDNSNPKVFLDQVKSMIAAMLGDTTAEAKLAELYTKYIK